MKIKAKRSFASGSTIFSKNQVHEIDEQTAVLWENAGLVDIVKETTATNEPGFENMEYKDLKNLAKEKGIKGYTTKGKNELIELLKGV